jgi:hypothetical protein
MSTREMVVAGQFYPDNSKQIDDWFDRWKSEPIPKRNFTPKALIVPHAGYMYSGLCAYKAYKQVQENIEQVIVIGPSHRIAFEGASVGLFKQIQTPYGKIECNEHTNKTLLDSFFWLNYLPIAHKEHSTEVQFPFIKKLFPNACVTEIVYSSIDSKTLSNLIETCLKFQNTLIVISTDLSHFYSLEEANKLDSNCIEAIKNVNTEKLKNCEACGIVGMSALILSAFKNKWNSQVIEYTTSYDQSGDKSQVVGYVSAILG